MWWLLDWEGWGRHCYPPWLLLLPLTRKNSNLCSGMCLLPKLLVFQISFKNSSYLDSSKTVWSSILDIDFCINPVRDVFLHYFGQNWFFVFWNPDIHWRNSSLPVQSSVIEQSTSIWFLLQNPISAVVCLCRIPPAFFGMQLSLHSNKTQLRETYWHCSGYSR